MSAFKDGSQNYFEPVEGFNACAFVSKQKKT